MNFNVDKVGRSYFYLNHKDKATILSYECKFDAPVNIEKLKEAVAMALKQFPSFRIRTSLDANGCLVTDENTNEVPVSVGFDRYLYLGSDETNGYLFCVTTDENLIKLSVSHVLSDARGMFAFMKLILHYYFKLSGYDVNPALVQYSEADPETDSVADTLFEMCEKISVSPDEAINPIAPETVFQIPEECVLSDTPFARTFNIVWDNEKFIKIVHEFDTSFVCLVKAVIDEAIYRNYDVQDKRIVASVPVDLRGILHSRAQANFTTNIPLVYEPSYASMSMKEKTQLLRSSLKAQMTRDNLIARVQKSSDPSFDALMRAPVAVQIDLLEKANFYGNIAKSLGTSYLLTNIGALNFPEDMAIHIHDFKFIATDLANTPAFFLLSYKNGSEGTMLVHQNYEDKKVLESFCDILRECGVSDVKLVDEGKARTHKLDMRHFSKQK